MVVRRGWLAYDTRRDRYFVDWRQSLSIIAGELLLEEILGARVLLRGRLLDVGCGERPYGVLYDRLVDMKVATEVTFSPHGTAAADVICFAEALPFAQAAFDTVICTEVLEHTVQPSVALRELSRVLRPNGILLLSVPFIYPTHEAPHDYWRFTIHGLEALCRSTDLEPLYIRARGGVGATIMTLWVNTLIRAINGLGLLLRMKRAPREIGIVRWLVALPQWVYLWTRRYLKRLGPKKLDSWMTLGWIVVARRVEGQDDTGQTESRATSND